MRRSKELSVRRSSVSPLSGRLEQNRRETPERAKGGACDDVRPHLSGLTLFRNSSFPVMCTNVSSSFSCQHVSCLMFKLHVGPDVAVLDLARASTFRNCLHWTGQNLLHKTDWLGWGHIDKKKRRDFLGRALARFFKVGGPAA
jgi:hypothetical protein